MSNIAVVNLLPADDLQSSWCPGVSPQERGVLVKQSFQVRLLQDTPLSTELCRITTGQGAVIRYMRDGSTEVLTNTDWEFQARRCVVFN